MFIVSIRCQYPPSALKRAEPFGQSRASLNNVVVLLDDVIQVSALSQPITPREFAFGF